MILLDTNVISELMRPQPDACFGTWFDGQLSAETCITCISVMEIEYGIALLPEGKRRSTLEANAKLIVSAFADRTLPFDTEAAVICARIRAERRASGRPLVDIADAAIAAIALARQLPLATRNLDDFAHLGLDLINPWDMPAS